MLKKYKRLFLKLFAVISAGGCSDNAGALTLDLGRGITMELVRVPGGEFVMGSPDSEPGRGDDEGPQRLVAIRKPFYIGRCEVTQAQWRAVMGSEPWDGGEWTKSGDNHAASYITWALASEFCKTLSKQIGRKVALPTEAQWEYACRAGGQTTYSFGDYASQLGDFAWCKDNAWDANHMYPHPVGQN